MSKLPQNWKIIFSIVSIILLFGLIWIFRAIIAYVIIAVVVAFICDPLDKLLKRVRIKKFYLPSWFRALFSLACFIGLIAGMIAMFSPLVSEEVQLISEMDTAAVSQNIQTQLKSVIGEEMDVAGVTDYLIESAKNIFSFQWIQDFFNNVFGIVGSFVVGIFAVFFIAFYFLKDGFLFARIVFTLTPEEHLSKIKRIMEHTHDLLRRYFIGVGIQSLIMAAFVAIALSILGVQNAVLIGLFAGLVNVIPYVGPLLGGTIGILIALTTSLHLDFATAIMPLLLRVLVVFVVAQQIDGFIVQPLVLGNSVKAHPLEIFIVVLMAGTLGGILGMILAIPVYTILRVVAREFLSEFKVVESLTRDLLEGKSKE